MGGLCGTKGLVLGGKYRLVSLLGRGAMGEVWRAEHLALRSRIAVKLIDVQLLETGATQEREDLVTRFRREALAAASLQSPHVVHVIDHGVDDRRPFIAMELLDGETLEDRLGRTGRLPHAETVRILTHVARAMTRAHEQGIVHRDLKPENVFLVANDGDEIAKVLDFGVAKLTHAKLDAGGRLTAEGSLIGTPCYMSPEQASGRDEVDWRTDLWAIGVMAFECVVGRRPFEGEHVGDLVLHICIHPMPVPSALAAVPDGFDAWWARACAREPAERFQSARELVDELADVLLGARPPRSSSFVSGHVLPRAPAETLGLDAGPTAIRRRSRGRVDLTMAAFACIAGIVAVAGSTSDSALATAAVVDDARAPGELPDESDAVPALGAALPASEGSAPQPPSLTLASDSPPTTPASGARRGDRPGAAPPDATHGARGARAPASRSHLQRRRVGANADAKSADRIGL